MDLKEHDRRTSVLQFQINREVERLRNEGIDDETIRAHLTVLIERAIKA